MFYMKTQKSVYLSSQGLPQEGFVHGRHPEEQKMALSSAIREGFPEEVIAELGLTVYSCVVEAGAVKDGGSPGRGTASGLTGVC